MGRRSVGRGKSASFYEIDFAERPWVPHSGWPISRSALMPFVDRARAILNLGPNRYDDTLWQLIDHPPPTPAFDGTAFSSFFWQFSKSRLDPLNSTRMGADFAALDAPNVRVLLNATVLRLWTDEGGGRFEALDVSTLEGMRASVRARACVLAASAIENARLLLLSNETHPAGLGNHNDLVGRYLTDHILSPLGRFDAAQAKAVGRRFGFYGMRHAGRSHMYSHGLALSAERQHQGLLNGALLFMEKRSHDDPFSALG